MDSAVPHIPVMLDQAMGTLKPEAGAVFVDGTFGAGGYSRAILETGARVIAFDHDPSTAERAERLRQEFPDTFSLFHRPYSELLSVLSECELSHVDGIVLDIGVSSMQLDQAVRGFSFRQDGPLDMRMGDVELDATSIVNGWSEQELAELFYKYGEERRSRAIARLICETREDWPIKTTRALAHLIERLSPQSRSKGKPAIHPATRTFQALRIAVNDELIELARVLHAAESALSDQGRLVVVTFHSLEDRIVKRFLADASSFQQSSRHLPSAEHRDPTFVLSHRRPLVAEDQEVAVNPRSRSAKLRSAVRTANAARSPDVDLERARHLGLPLIARDKLRLAQQTRHAQASNKGGHNAVA